MSSSTGCRGAFVSRSVFTAIGRTPVLANPSSSSSWRLYSESPSARSDAGARPASSSRAIDASRNSDGAYGAKNRAGVTLWYCSTRPCGSAANAADIGDGSA